MPLPRPEEAGDFDLALATQQISSRLRATWIQHRLDAAGQREAAAYRTITVLPRKRMLLALTACDLAFFLAMIIYLGATNSLNNTLTTDVFTHGGSFTISFWLDPGSEITQTSNCRTPLRVEIVVVVTVCFYCSPGLNSVDAQVCLCPSSLFLLSSTSSVL